MIYTYVFSKLQKLTSYFIIEELKFSSHFDVFINKTSKLKQIRKAYFPTYFKVKNNKLLSFRLYLTKFILSPCLCE